MTAEQKQIILRGWDYCDVQDKSTEFMLQYLSDTSGVDYDEVVEYICSEQADKDRKEYYRNLNIIL